MDLNFGSNKLGFGYRNNFRDIICGVEGIPRKFYIIGNVINFSFATSFTFSFH